MLESGQAHEPEQLLGIGMLAVTVTGHLQGKPHVAEHVEPWQEHGVLEHEAKKPSATRGVRRFAVNEDPSGGRRIEVGDDPQDGRLAAPARTDERDELAFADLQVDVGKRGQ